MVQPSRLSWLFLLLILLLDPECQIAAPGRSTGGIPGLHIPGVKRRSQCRRPSDAAGAGTRGCTDFGRGIPAREDASGRSP